jgi:hypothetical protein
MYRWTKLSHEGAVNLLADLTERRIAQGEERAGAHEQAIETIQGAYEYVFGKEETPAT